MGPVTSDEWARERFGRAELGDARRTERLITLANSLAGDAGASPAKASENPAALEGAYRFLRNESVDAEAIGIAGFQATAEAAAKLSVLLVVEDTTTLSYKHDVAEELGDLGGTEDGRSRGYFVHSALVLDGHTGETVGLVDQQYWMRDSGKRGQRHERHVRAYRDKESFKWQKSSERIRSLFGDEAMGKAVSVCDREADVYEYLNYKLECKERFVVRASRDRVLAVQSAIPAERKLFAFMLKAPSYGTLKVDVPQRGGRHARTATLTIRAAQVRLRRARHTDASLPKSREVNVVLAHEENPPQGVKEPLTWFLLTTEPIGSHDELVQVLRYYRLRWRIEEFHKAWKSGAGVERRRLQSPTNLHRLAVILAFVAVRLLQLRELAEATPDAPCDTLLPELHWQVLWASREKKRLPDNIPSLQWALKALGRLGGWKDTKRTGRIGWDAVWEGWSKLQDRLDGYHAAALVAEARRR
jgi:transposase-like protein/DDE family transposase